MMASCEKSKRTSAGRTLLPVPEVNGNWQMKTSPNMSAAGIVERVVRRVVAEELRVCTRMPVSVVGVLAGENNDPRPARPGQLGGNGGGNRQNRSAAQLSGKFNGVHGRNGIALRESRQ